MALLVTLAAGVPTARAEAYALKLEIVHAHRAKNHIDPPLRRLVEEFPKLREKFTAFELEDHATFNLQVGAVGRMQLPNGKWMDIHNQGPAEDGDGKLRIRVEVKDLKFSATVTIDAGATLAVGGPEHKGGSLILVMTRPKGP